MHTLCRIGNECKPYQHCLNAHMNSADNFGSTSIPSLWDRNEASDIVAHAKMSNKFQVVLKSASAGKLCRVRSHWIPLHNEDWWGMGLANADATYKACTNVHSVHFPRFPRMQLPTNSGTTSRKRKSSVNFAPWNRRHPARRQLAGWNRLFLKLSLGAKMCQDIPSTWTTMAYPWQIYANLNGGVNHGATSSLTSSGYLGFVPKCLTTSKYQTASNCRVWKAKKNAMPVGHRQTTGRCVTAWNPLGLWPI